jgi:hypothetical protein
MDLSVQSRPPLRAGIKHSKAVLKHTFLDTFSLYMLVYTAFTFAAWESPLFYSFHLLDVIIRSALLKVKDCQCASLRRKERG